MAARRRRPPPSAPRRIAIGSQHPAKVAAATAVLRQAFPHAQIIALTVDSGVRPAPTSAEETPHGTFLGGWAAVVDRSGRVGLGGGMRIALPPEVAELARRGRDLGEVVRERSGLEEVEVGGTIGCPPRRLVTREEAHRQAIAAALAPFLPGAVE